MSIEQCTLVEINYINRALLKFNCVPLEKIAVIFIFLMKTSSFNSGFRSVKTIYGTVRKKIIIINNSITRPFKKVLLIHHYVVTITTGVKTLFKIQLNTLVL